MAFIWYELMTTDPDAAAAFYGPVVGWKISDHSDPQAGGVDYRLIIRSDGGHEGGVLRITPEMTAGGARPAWMPYLHVGDVDAVVGAIVDDGGKLLMPKMTIEVGSFAMVADPQGVPFYVMDPIPPAGKEKSESDVFSPTEDQRVSWNELASPDLEASKAFYSMHFGFEFNETMPMGELGDYCFIDHNGRRLGAIMQRQDERQPALWLFYFRVPSLAAAKAAVEANGGAVMMGPMEVPEDDWVIVATDPQGAVFGLVGAKGE